MSMSPNTGPPAPLQGMDRAKRAAAQAWLLGVNAGGRPSSSQGSPQMAMTEWTNHGVALLRAGITWDVVRVPYTVLDTDFDGDAEPDALRRRLEELEVSGAVFCDPYRPFLYFMVPPGSDEKWPRDLASVGVECLGGTRPYIHHVGVPRMDRDKLPGPFWLLPPDNGTRRLVDPHLLYTALHTCIARRDPLTSGTP